VGFIQFHYSFISLLNMSQVLPAFTCSAIFVGSKAEDKDGEKTGKMVLNFGTEAINKHFGTNTYLSPVQTSAMGGCLQTKITVKEYSSLKGHFLEGNKFNLIVCPAAWGSDKGSGTWFECIDIAPASA
jgi:hypothetical protein